MDWRMPLRVVDKLQISSANCMDGTGRSWSLGGGGGGGGVQPVLNVNIRSAMKRLKIGGRGGHPGGGPR